ncbi:unnamed protein product [Allacma fusca]|uniref:Asparaginase n=1 Tax=Allacma fusca TaxID=39272 RepID=A0A8J2LQR4_9HEXA|nr:unnamed protein product [Allacma fusca]
MESEPVIVIHGGAWAIPDSLVASSLAGVQAAAQAGWKILSSGGSAVDAVEATIVVLENDPTFDAGTGSVLTTDGTVEMDAIIMEGENLNLGAVACLGNVKNPIRVARLVMEKTDHTLLVGQGALEFAKEIGVPTISTESLATPAGWAELERFKTYNKAVRGNFSERQGYGKLSGHDTVGCVALDKRGLLACGTSTGGITGKRCGRVGDSPLVGCGAYADKTAGAVSCTGHGESISKVCLARRILENCEQGIESEEAIQHGLSFMRRRVGNAGGAVCIDRKGNPGIGFNTARMAWAAIVRNKATSGINPGDMICFSE